MRSCLHCALLFILLLITPARAEFPPFSEVAEHIPQAGSLLVNGSFEMGLGAEPFYPGWLAREEYIGSSAPSTAPPMPEIVDDAGQLNCLKIHGSFDKRALLFFRMVLETNTQYTLRFKAKASRDGIVINTLKAGSTGYPILKPRTSALNPMPTTWRNYYMTLSSAKTGTFPSIRLQTTDVATNGTYEILLDDFTLLKGSDKTTAGQDYSLGAAEIVLIPGDRTGVIMHDNLLPLNWRLHGTYPNDVRLVHYLYDIGRDQVFAPQELDTLNLTDGQVHEGAEPRSNLKRGHYLSLIAVLDAQTDSLISVGREFFAVMSDLEGLNTMEFRPGMLKGVRTNANEKEYNWRGFWSTDDFFKQCFRNGIRVQKLGYGLASLADYPGHYNWFLDTEINTAHSNGVDTMVIFPSSPPKIERQEYDAMMLSPPDAKPGYWWKQQAELVAIEDMRAPTNALDWQVFPLPPPELLTQTSEKLAQRYGNRLKFIEYRNEANRHVYPRIMMNDVARYVYPAIKSISPETELFLGTTADIDGDNPTIESYSATFFEIGGTNYADGYNFHAYGGATIMPTRPDEVDPEADGNVGGVGRASIYRQRAQRYNMNFGQSECHFFDPKHQANRGKLPPWMHMQRYMIDHAFGARMSTSLDVESIFGVETGSTSRRNRGAMPPSGSMVALNAMHRVLEGARVIAPIEKDDHLLIGTFELDKISVGTRYAAALAIGDNHKIAELIGDLASIPDLVAYDIFGEEYAAPLTNGALYIDYEMLYLESSSPRLIDVLETATLNWHNGIGVKRRTVLPNDGPNLHLKNMAHYGNSLFSKGMLIGRARAQMTDSVVSSYTANLLNLNLEQLGREIISDDTETFVLENDKLPGTGSYAELSILCASADAVYDQLLNFGIYGGAQSTIFLNGEKIHEGPIHPEDFRTRWEGGHFDIPLGLSLIEIFIAQPGGIVLVQIAEEQISNPLPTYFSQQPVEDTHASTPHNHNIPLGSLAKLQVRGRKDKGRYPFIKFDLRGEPGHYSNVVFNIWSYGSQKNELWIKLVDDNSWSDKTLTWANAPFDAVLEPALDTAIATNGWLRFNLSSVIKGPGIYSFLLCEDEYYNLTRITDLAGIDGPNRPFIEIERWPLGAGPDDFDGDKIPNHLERAYHLNPHDPTDAAKDADLDGMSNLDEILAGMNPTNAASLFAFTAIDALANATALEWNSASGHTYRIEYSEDLHTWHPLPAAEQIRAEDLLTGHIDTNSADKRFYRIIALPAP